MFISRSNKVNLDAVLKLIILLGFSIFFFAIIQTGKIQLYVNPRIVPYVKFGIVVMVITSLFFIRDIFKPKRKVNLTQYLFFLIPLFMAFSLPAKSMDSTSMAFGDVTLAQPQNSSKNNISSDNIASGSSVDTNTIIDNGQSSGSLDSVKAGPDQLDSGLKLQGDTIVVSDNNFVQWLQEIYDNMSKYEGKKIEVVGFVYKDKTLKKNEFFPARLMMACCTADLQPVGLLCRYDKAPELKKDTWLKVTGTIKTIDLSGQKTPAIIADKVESAVKPEIEYVYPY